MNQQAGISRLQFSRSDRAAGRAGLPTTSWTGDTPLDFLGYVVLVTHFGGDIDRWLAHIAEQGSADQRRAAAPFAQRVRRRLRRDPRLFERVRGQVERFERVNQATTGGQLTRQMEVLSNR